MNLLEAAIALALSLAALATVCTVLVELVHRVLRLRSAGLRQMLEAYFDHAVLPRIRERIPRDAHGKPMSADTLRTDMVDTLVRNPLHERLARPEGPLGGLFASIYRPLRDYTAVNTEEFLRRLPDSQCFRALAADAQQDMQAVIGELEARYDSFGTGISDYFKRRAQLLSMLCGVVLALAANIDGVRIFDVFARDAELRARVLAQAEDIERRVDAAQGGAPGSAGESNAAVRSEAEQLRERMQELEGLGLPIGWRYYPNCLQQNSEAGPQCRAVRDAGATCPKGQPCGLIDSIWRTAGTNPAAFAGWLFTALVTGMLIGLGGPFWFDVAMRLSRVRQALTGKPAAAQAGQPGAPEGERQALREEAARRLAASAARPPARRRTRPRRPS